MTGGADKAKTTIAQDLTAAALVLVQVRRRIAYESSDRAQAARACATLDELVAWLEDEAERRR